MCPNAPSVVPQMGLDNSSKSSVHTVNMKYLEQT